jgi:hypothetical protein
MTTLILEFISGVWFLTGLPLLAVPTLWDRWVRGMRDNPSSYFLVLHGVLLIHLLLILTTERYQGAWLWMGLGAVGLLGCVLLLAGSHTRRLSFLDRLLTVPLWLRRLSAVLLVALATLLAIDGLRGTLS